jgi:hypothetical protein
VTGAELGNVTVDTLKEGNTMGITGVGMRVASRPVLIRPEGVCVLKNYGGPYELVTAQRYAAINGMFNAHQKFDLVFRVQEPGVWGTLKVSDCVLLAKYPY